MPHTFIRPLFFFLVTLAVCLGGIMEASPAFAQPPAKRWVESSGTHRIALVIGNGDYEFGPKLKNPVNDAQAIGKALKSLGFTVVLLTDGTRRQMLDAIDSFGEKLTGDCVALCYYSGHGVQIDGTNYLLPVDFRGRSRADAEDEAIAARRILGRFDEKHSPVNILVLDACRNNPFRSFTRSGETGLGRMDAPRGTLIAYATAPGSLADDNSQGVNGLYTAALLKELYKPGVKVEEMFKQVLEDVASASGERQTPWIESSLRGSLYLVKGSEAIAKKEMPHSVSGVLPRTKVNSKDGALAILVPAGEFDMGEDNDAVQDVSSHVRNNPRHTARVSSFYIYKNLVTVEMYEKFCKETGRDMPPAPGFNPDWSKKDHPIVNVSWADAAAYADWAGGQLPTEAQWEKAARWDGKAKRSYLYPWGDTFDKEKLHCSGNSFADAGGTVPVGSFVQGASPYGVQDMAGNVWQWCRDWYDSGFLSSRSASLLDPVNESVGDMGTRVLKGGSWQNNDPSFFQSAFRLWGKPVNGYEFNGFRCVLIARP